MSKNKESNEVSLVRVFNASPSAVYKMWTDPERFAKWYGPKGVTVEECELDVRPGGKFSITMKMPNGKLYPSPGMYHELIENEKIVFSLFMYDEKGEVSIEMLHTVTFQEENGNTVQSFNVVTVKTVSGIDPLKGLDQAWGSSFDKLEEIV